MDDKYYQQAEQLADQYHLVRIDHEYLSSGDLVFVASNPEFPNCYGSGETENKAIADLQNARIEYIAYLLQYNLPVPKPSQVNTITFNIYTPQSLASRVSEPSVAYYSTKQMSGQPGSDLVGRFVEADVAMSC